MKKTLFFLYCAFCLQITAAQRSAGYIAPDRLLQEGKWLYDNRNYAGCIAKLLEFKQTAAGEELPEEVDFLSAASAFHLGKTDAGLALERFLDNYPVNRHRDEACFIIGSAYYKQTDYQTAIDWFLQADADKLPAQEQEDYACLLAYSYLQIRRNAEAKRLFSMLRDKSANYRGEATYYSAYIAYTEGDYKQALPLFNEIKNQKAFHPDVFYYLTQINFAQKRYEQTIAEGRKLLNDYPAHSYNAEMNRLVGLSYFRQADYRNAIKYLKTYFAAAENPQPDDFYTLGLSCFFQKNYPEAIEYLSKSEPGNDLRGQSAYLYLGQAYLKQADADRALMAFQSASRMDFDLQAKEAATYNYAMLLHQNSVSAFGESVTVLENFLNTYPKSIYSDNVNSALIDVYLTTKDYETALASIAKIKNPAAKIREASQKIYYYLGSVHFTNKDYAAAIQYFTQAINAGNYAVNEKNEALYWRAESYYQTNNYAQAATDFQSCLDTENSGNLSALAAYGLAYCAFNRRQYHAAEAGFRKYIQTEKDNPAALADAYARLGDCCFHNRRLRDAENAYSHSVRIMPSTGDYAVFRQGYVAGLQKNYTGKIKLMDKLVADYPESPYTPDALYEKGRAYVLLENETAAINTYQDLCSRFPENSNARKAGLQIGLLYFKTGRLEKAAEAYKKVIGKYPGSEEAITAVQDLKSVYLDMNNISGYAQYIESLGGAVKFDATEQDSLTYIAAERFFMRNNVKQAKSGMINYLQSFPNGAFGVNAHYYLAQMYYTEKDYPAAKREFQKVLDAGNNRFTEEALLRTADLLYKEKDYNGALPLYERLQNTAENKSGRTEGALGAMRSAARLHKPDRASAAADFLLKNAASDPQIKEEAKYYRAKAFLERGEKTLAEKDLLDLSKDTRTAFGAEAKYLLAQNYFDNKQIGRAKDVISDYTRQGTPHAYWLARSFILMSDICLAEGDKLQARQYLESLQNNYKRQGDDIRSIINERLGKM
ncbi:MAG: tetratricopeptide repeat protein [Dysgonamonadaceae bacterium]|jgi:tetratricopeptide (TPR) repeat protein|nr:tetratricopeptide repeat protein [Dysgonamonadaceae bacterium]